MKDLHTEEMVYPVMWNSIIPWDFLMDFVFGRRQREADFKWRYLLRLIRIRIHFLVNDASLERSRDSLIRRTFYVYNLSEHCKLKL